MTAIARAIIVALELRSSCCFATIYSYTAFKPRCSSCHSYL
jgi:hypothetical protein